MNAEEMFKELGYKVEFNEEEQRIEVVRLIDKQQALEIIDKRDFFNDRAGRELWNDKPKEIQDEDIRNAHEEYEQLKEYVLNQPKVGEWIPIKENEPSCNGQYLMFVRIYNKYGSEDKYIVADYYDGLFDVYPYIEVENCEVEVLAWQPLPEYPRPYSSGD